MMLNHHRPLGSGTIDLVDYCRRLAAVGFHVPAILEIGGAPWSGGYGQDSDDALRESLARLRQACAAAEAD